MDRSMITVRFFLFASLAAISLPAKAAEIQKTAPDRVKLTGIIQRDDSEKLRPLLEGVRTVIVDSAGGDTLGSLRLGELVLSHNLDVIVDGKCWSGCADGIFSAARHSTVLRRSTVCFHGGRFKNTGEMWERAGGKEVYRKALFDKLTTLTLNELRNGPEYSRNFFRKKIDDVKKTWPAKSDEAIIMEQIAKDVDVMAEAREKDFAERLKEADRIRKKIFQSRSITIIDDSKYIYINPRLNKIIGSSKINPYDIMWCPSPEELQQYGYKSLEMWYPDTEEDLFNLAPQGVILSKYHYDLQTGQPNESGSRHVEAKTVVAISDTEFTRTSEEEVKRLLEKEGNAGSKP